MTLSRDMSVDDVEVSMEEILGVLGKEEYSEFEEVMTVCDAILSDPTKFIGFQSLVTAAKLSAIRTKIGNRAQYYKTVNDKSMLTRRRKDLLMAMYSSLEENINTLKLLGRVDAKM